VKCSTKVTRVFYLAITMDLIYEVRNVLNNWIAARVRIDKPSLHCFQRSAPKKSGTLCICALNLFKGIPVEFKPCLISTDWNDDGLCIDGEIKFEFLKCRHSRKEC
jgi:hypothetical protein